MTFFPDEKEPHLHYEGNDIIFTDIGHHHKVLKKGELIYESNVHAILQDLRQAHRARETMIADRINQDTGIQG